MKEEKEITLLLYAGFVAAFTTLAFIGTTIIRIPIPASGGYFNLGDTFVMLAALLYGPIVGGIVGFLGPGLSDAIGFPQFILATAIVKSIEGIIVGLVGYQRKKILRERTLFALILGIVVLVSGYYIFEAFIYPGLAKSIPFFGVTDKNAALAELLPNILQGLFSAIIAFGIWSAFRGRKNS